MNTNSGVPTLGVKIIASTPVPIPQLEEQASIAHALSALAARSACEEKVNNRLQNVKAALMSVLLTGEIRVKVGEGYDEPAGAEAN